MLLDYEMEYKLIALTGPIISSEQPNVNMVIVAVLRYQTRVIPWLPEAPIRPVSTQENKHRTKLSPFCTIHTAGPKKVENTSTLYHPGCGSQVQTGTENWYRKPMRGFNFVLIRSDPMLIFLSGNRRLENPISAYLLLLSTMQL